jgi:hypothetical protein
MAWSSVWIKSLPGVVVLVLNSAYGAPEKCTAMFAA